MTVCDPAPFGSPALSAKAPAVAMPLPTPATSPLAVTLEGDSVVKGKMPPYGHGSPDGVVAFGGTLKVSKWVPQSPPIGSRFTRYGLSAGETGSSWLESLVRVRCVPLLPTYDTCATMCCGNSCCTSRCHCC